MQIVGVPMWQLKSCSKVSIRHGSWFSNRDLSQEMILFLPSYLLYAEKSRNLINMSWVSRIHQSWISIISPGKFTFPFLKFSVKRHGKVRTRESG